MQFKYFIFIFFFTGSALAPVEYSKKQQFIYCRDLLYTKYPKEINKNAWNNCMNKNIYYAS